MKKAILRYSFLFFLPVLFYYCNEYTSDSVADTWVFLGGTVSIAAYYFSKKTIFHVIYFNYLVIWFCVGTINFVFFRLIWVGWFGEILLYNKLFVLYLTIYSLSALYINRNTNSNINGSITSVDLDLVPASKILWVIIGIFALLLLPRVGWTGILTGAVSDSTRFYIEMPIVLSRLSLAFPLLACILCFRFIRSEVSGKLLAFFLIFSFYITSVGGARFGFFQVLLTLVIFLLISNNISTIRKYRVPLAATFILFICVYQLISGLRSSVVTNESVLPSVFTFFSGWAGEHRDAAVSLYILSKEEINAISSNYVPSLLAPLIPAPILSMVGINKDAIMNSGAAYIMQTALSIPDGAIRIGGVAEVYLAFGSLGVVMAAIITAVLVGMIDQVAHSAKKRLSSVLFASYGSVWVIYFVASQNNMLLGGFVSFIILFYAVKYTVKIFTINKNEVLLVDGKAAK